MVASGSQYGLSMKNVGGKVTFITGAASGIGLALSRACAENGMKVMLADIDENGLDGALRELEGAGAETGSVYCDVTDLESMQQAAKATIGRFGKIQMLHRQIPEFNQSPVFVDSAISLFC